MHAARAYAELNGAIYPAYGIHDWLRLTQRTHRLTPEGRVIADYDKQIAAPLRLEGHAAGIDLPPAFRAFGASPVMIMRGQLSVIMAQQAAANMQAALPRDRLVGVAR